MGIISSVLLTIVILAILPMVLGLIWEKVYGDSLLFIYISGFITMLSVFQVIGVPMVFGFVPLHIQVYIYTGVFSLLTGAVLYFYRDRLSVKIFSEGLKILKNRLFSIFSRSDNYDKFYFVILFFLLALEVYFTIFYDIGNRRSDDAYYAVISSAAIHDDGFFLTDSSGGIFTPYVVPKYGLCGIFVFYTYVSYVTGLNIAIIQQTVCSTLFLLMANGAYYLLSKELFEKEERDNRMIFMIILSITFLFGYHSAYSLTFRLLGPIWQGKAILAVVITPFLIVSFFRIKNDCLKKAEAFFLIDISIAAISLTLGGIVVMVVIPGILAVLLWVNSKEVKRIICLPLLWIYPFTIMAVYIGIK